MLNTSSNVAWHLAGLAQSEHQILHNDWFQRLNLILTTRRRGTAEESVKMRLKAQGSRDRRKTHRHLKCRRVFLALDAEERVRELSWVVKERKKQKKRAVPRTTEDDSRNERARARKFSAHRPRTRVEAARNSSAGKTSSFPYLNGTTASRVE
jgi:hypothetical protein